MRAAADVAFSGLFLVTSWCSLQHYKEDRSTESVHVIAIELNANYVNFERSPFPGTLAAGCNATLGPPFFPPGGRR